MKYDFVFWIDDINLHLSDLIRLLSEKRNVLVIAHKHFSEERRNSGWYIPSLGNAKLITEPTDSVLKNAVDSNLKAIHIFLGINGFKRVYKGFKYAVSKKVKIGVISESGINLGIKGKLRKIKFIINAIRFGNKIDFILVIGDLGMKWFTDSFYPKNKLYAFLYVVANDNSKLEDHKKSNDENVNLVVVAQCIKRKNISLLLRSLSNQKKTSWNLTIIGEGNLKHKLINLTKELRLEDQINFLGMIPNKAVRNHLKFSDLCILPSKWDGWGAIVNESLMSGTPVICSNTCGSSCLIDGEVRGGVFKSNSIDSLDEVLSKWIAKGKVDIYSRREIIKWAECLSGDLVSDYLLDIVEYVYSDKSTSKPLEPWR